MAKTRKSMFLTLAVSVPILFLLAFGYQAGKSMAKSDNAKVEAPEARK